MSVEKVKDFFAAHGMQDRVLEFPVSSATVELAAQALNCEPAHIAKTLAFQQGEGCLLVVAAGDAKVDNRRFRDEFGFKPKMLPAEQVAELCGHAVGGVCPFAVNPGVSVYLDESLQRFALVYPAAGSSNSAIGLNLAELEELSAAVKWVDVCKAWREDEQA